jgi:hypothetical protein
MPVLTEGRYAGECVVSEGNGRISRETITVLSGQNLEAAAVLGKVTASGKYKALDPAASDGSQTAAGGPLRRGRCLGRRCRGGRHHPPGRGQRRRAGLARRHHLGPEGHRAWPARRAFHHRPLTRGNYSKDHADACARYLRQLRLHHGGADRCHQQDALRAGTDRPARPVPRAGRLHHLSHDRGARGQPQPRRDHSTRRACDPEHDQQAQGPLAGGAAHRAGGHHPRRRGAERPRLSVPRACSRACRRW